MLWATSKKDIVPTDPWVNLCLLVEEQGRSETLQNPNHSTVLRFSQADTRVPPWQTCFLPAGPPRGCGGLGPPQAPQRGRRAGYRPLSQGTDSQGRPRWQREWNEGSPQAEGLRGRRAWPGQTYPSVLPEGLSSPDQRSREPRRSPAGQRHADSSSGKRVVSVSVQTHGKHSVSVSLAPLSSPWTAPCRNSGFQQRR